MSIAYIRTKSGRMIPIPQDPLKTRAMFIEETEPLGLSPEAKEMLIKELEARGFWDTPGAAGGIDPGLIDSVSQFCVEMKQKIKQAGHPVGNQTRPKRRGARVVKRKPRRRIKRH